MTKRLFIMALAITAVIIVSCSKKTLEWDTDIAAPLFKTELSIANILPDSILATDADNSISIIIDKELFSASTATIAEFPDSLFKFDLDIPQNTALAPGVLFFYKDELQKLAIDPVELNYVNIYSGDLTFNVINPFDKPLEITYKIPSATKYGISFNETIIIPPGNQSATPYVAHINMANYDIDLRGPDANTSNHFMTRMTARISSASTDSAHSVNNKLHINIKFQNVVLNYLKGYFGKIATSYGPESVQTEIFKIFTDGELQIDKCTAQLEISNGFGADARMQLQSLKAINSTTGKELALQSGLINKPINITRATESGTAGSVICSKSSLDFSSSNITDLLTIFPDRLDYAATLELNPLGNISAGNDFAYRAHPFSAKLHFEMPLKFSAKGVTLQKEIPYDLGSGIDAINSATLHLIADNTFPLDARIKLQIADEAGNPIMDIPQNESLLQAAALLPDGTTTPRHSVIHFSLNEKETQIFNENKKIRITAVFDTPENQEIKIHDSYKLNLKLTADFNYSIYVNK